MLAQNVPEGFLYLEDTDNWGILSSPAAELTGEEEDLE
jgi:hypothetical protein